MLWMWKRGALGYVTEGYRWSVKKARDGWTLHYGTSMRFIALFETSADAKASAEYLEASPDCYVCGAKIGVDEKWMMVMEMDGGERWCEKCAPSATRGDIDL